MGRRRGRVLARRRGPAAPRHDSAHGRTAPPRPRRGTRLVGSPLARTQPVRRGSRTGHPAGVGTAVAAVQRRHRQAPCAAALRNHLRAGGPAAAAAALAGGAVLAQSGPALAYADNATALVVDLVVEPAVDRAD
ncbi:hypothetical protein ACU686_26515 [Yinghuangia aomiensis]